MASSRTAASEPTIRTALTWRTADDLALPPILAAAVVDFEQHGYHGTTVRNIAARVGLTMPALYYHYGSKEGILFALLDIAMDDLLARVRGALEEAGNDTSTQFSNFVTAVALHNTHRRDLALLHDEFRFLGTELRTRYVAKRRVIQETLVDLVNAGVAEAIFETENAHFISLVILGMLRGIVVWFTKDGPLTAEEVAEKYAQSALRLVAANRAHTT